MKHIRTITTARADAFITFYNAIWRAWQNYRFEKKNEVLF
jgi:hypothetical protein